MDGPSKRTWTEPLPYLGVGLVSAPLLGVLPLFGWLFGALCHELGHTVVAWFFGRPAIPHISPGGMALTTHQDPNLFFVLSVPLLVGVALWHALPAAWRLIVLPALAAILALGHLGFESELLLVGGHLGEWALATVFLVRAWTGGWTHSNAERALYATCGFYLLGANLKLTLGLALTESMRAWYRGPGVGACENDYVRLAQDWGWQLESVAALMTLPALIVLPLAVTIGVLLNPPAASTVARVRIESEPISNRVVL